MKSVYYLAVDQTYRWALDAAALDPAGYRCDPAWLAELEKVSPGYTTGFYLQLKGKVCRSES